jgi:hypothetical protein
LCETLTDQLAAVRWRQLGSVFDAPSAAFRELNRWAHEDRARIEATGRSRDDQGKGEVQIVGGDRRSTNVSNSNNGNVSNSNNANVFSPPL